MTEAIGLGRETATARWFGLRRDVALSGLLGAGLVAAWLVVARRDVALLALGVVVLSGAAPHDVGGTMVASLRIAGRYAMRPHLVTLDVAEGGPLDRWGYSLVQFGRLDLNGDDVRVMKSVVRVVDALALQREPQRAWVAAEAVAGRRDTLLCVPRDVTPEGPWQRLEGSRARLHRSGPVSVAWEGWRHLTTADGVVAVLRVVEYRAGSTGAALLHDLVTSDVDSTTVVTLEVLPHDRGRRRTQRAAHRVRSDLEAGQLFGFRRSATATNELLRAHQQEARVAVGRALVDVAVSVVLWSTDATSLTARVDDVVARARSHGLVLSRGHGRQGPWWCALDGYE